MPTIRRSAAPIVASLALLVAACGGGGDSADAGASSNAAVAGGATKAAAVASGPSGEKIYQQRCVSCHQVNGLGTPGVFPPLAGSEYADNANVAVPIRIVLHGLQGPIMVKGTEYNSLMPAYGIGIVMSDAEVAAVLTYIRSSWGASASAVTAEDVAREREATKGHSGAMTAELLKPLMAK
ncbi:MAG: cytochrome c [Gemmatimonadales bacterium]|nr:cytochrome c [Gemmatimonadota bacterium]MCL4212275.1 cytochrome c [Gemmatimonadales bacterium]